MSFSDKVRARLQAILARAETLERELTQDPPLPPSELTKRAKEQHELAPIVTCVKALEACAQEQNDLTPLLGDPDFKAEALAESERLKERSATLESQLKALLLPKDTADQKGVIVEIRSGTGGDEAALFARDLWQMYFRYAEARRWKTNVLSLSETDLGGVREVIFSIEGNGVFSRLKFESGIHRVQRIPETESGGRIHTSAATVAVLPEAEEVDIEINDDDLRIDTFRASGAGGQHVNKTESAIRITHLPTGLVVQQQDEKSQHKNKARALKILRSRLYDLERAAAEAKRSESRKSQVGSGDRSGRIRTYNAPQGRVTDHRIGLTLHQIETILGGQLDLLIDPLLAHDQAEKLAEM